ncbi:fibronectin type III domain-containing protein [Chromobacterium haemolyticum]|nr:fibronectin type III domain-containing protein [Chromobacterium haemolyticum]
MHGGGEGGRPGAPQNLKVDSRSDTAISLSWEASQGGEHAVTHYQLHRDDQPAGETSALNYLDSGLRPGTAYRYFVTALDAEGQASGPSNSVTASTTGGDPGPEFPEWLNEHDYQVGDGVSYQGLHYRCLQAHRSNPGWTPDVAFTLWGLA